MNKKLKTDFLRTLKDNYLYFDFVDKGTSFSKHEKVIVSAVATQLVFLLSDEALSYFTKIIIYPDYYLSTITGKKHKGEVNPGLRVIVFSQRGIIDGNKIKNDGINLLIHEFAHALWLEHKLTKHLYTVLDEQAVNQFESFAKNEIANKIDDENHFFRNYAFSNMEEFFAVAVENFFERPIEFQSKLPWLYQLLATLFKQNPLTVAPKAYNYFKSSFS